MPHVRVVHTTLYRYVQPVRFLPHRLMLRPHDSHDLWVRGAVLGLTPAAAVTRWAHDVFGNSVCLVEWTDTRSDSLQIVSTLDIDHYPATAELPRETLDPMAETYPFSYAPEEFPDLARMMERQHPDPARKVDAWVQRFLPRGKPARTMDVLAAITAAIKSDFTYAGREQEGTNAPRLTLETRQGACRDFALLMMEAVRALGLAARFVSGYLYSDDASSTTVGGGATHAWVSIYLPGAGWVEYDPTNGLIAGRNLIRVSVARAPEQAVPVVGGFVGGIRDFAGLTVDVTVTLKPDEAEPPPPPLVAA